MSHDPLTEVSGRRINLRRWFIRNSYFTLSRTILNAHGSIGSSGHLYTRNPLKRLLLSFNAPKVASLQLVFPAISAAKPVVFDSRGLRREPAKSIRGLAPRCN